MTSTKIVNIKSLEEARRLLGPELVNKYGLWYYREMDAEGAPANDVFIVYDVYTQNLISKTLIGADRNSVAIDAEQRFRVHRRKTGPSTLPIYFQTDSLSTTARAPSEVDILRLTDDTDFSKIRLLIVSA
jgi:hypothetical protein